MGVNNFTYSKSLEDFEAGFEGRKHQAYQDSKGVWTIGVGHTGIEVVPGLVWTDAQIDAAFAADNKWAQDWVNRMVLVSITQEENDALVDLVFNIGIGNFDSSTLLRDLNSGDFHGAAAQFDLWDHCGGAVLAGLLRRRQAETALFERGAAAQQAGAQ